MDRYKWKARLRSLGWFLFWTAVVIFFIRQNVGLIKDLNAPPVEASKQEVKVESAVPDGAKTVGTNFLVNWFFATEEESAEDKIRRLSKFITQRLESRIKQSRDLVYSDSDKKNMQANRVDLWSADWIEKDKRAKLVYRVVLQDGRVLFIQLSIIHSGSWMVDELPGIVPEPERKEPEAEDPPSIDTDQMKRVQPVIEGFFEAWLSGKEEGISRYSTSKMPASDLLQKIGGLYEGVTVEPVSEKPFQVRAKVKIRDANGIMHFGYLVSLVEKDGQWYVKSVQ